MSEVEGGRAPRVGVLSAGLGDKYATAILSGISTAACARGAEVVTFAGGTLEAGDGGEPHGNAIYDLASAESVDGLVILAGSLVNVVGAERLGAFVTRFSDLPIVSVAVPLPGATNVLVDSDRGMRSALEHLMEIHGRHRIAFIQGPPGNDEAARRFQVYEDVFGDYGMKLDPALVVSGTFSAESGAAAIETLYDRRKVRVDAIVAANDVMAIAALDALRARGTKVPREVSVIGFDDVEESSWSSPTLTTVGQPLERQGRVAVEMLLERLAGNAPSARAILPTQMVVRESCGCVLGRARASSITRPHTNPVASEKELRAPLLAAIQGVVDPADAPEIAHIVEALLDELFGKGGRFFSTLDGALGVRALRDAAVSPVQAAIGVLRRTAVPALDVTRATKAEDLLVRAHLEIAAAAERVQARRRIEAERIARQLSEVGQGLILANDESAVARVLAEVLPRLPIDRCRLAVYDRKRRSASPLAEVRRLLDYSHGAADLAPVRLPAHSVVATRQSRGATGDRPARGRTRVVQALYVRDRQHGFLVVESAPRHGLLHEELRALLSCALERIARTSR